MTMNIGGMGMEMYGMSMMGGMNQAQNIPQYYQMKYGCEDCFRKEPYDFELPKPVVVEPKNSLKPSLWRRFLNNIFGG